MSTLVIAPASNLNNVADWVSSANGRQLTVLNGTVTVREVLAAIASGKYRIIHFASHSDKVGRDCTSAIVMSDGEITDHQLVDAIRAANRKIELVILGVCSSIYIGNALYAAGVPRVLAWTYSVPDAAAVEWARTFYSSLSMSNDVWEAKTTAEEAVKRLGFDPPIFLNGRIPALEAKVEKLEKAAEVGGVPRWLVAVLIANWIVLLFMFFLLLELHR